MNFNCGLSINYVHHTYIVQAVKCDPICKNPEQSRILKKIQILHHGVLHTKAFFCRSIKAVIQIVLDLQG